MRVNHPGNHATALQIDHGGARAVWWNAHSRADADDPIAADHQG